MLFVPPRCCKKHNPTSILKKRSALDELTIPASKARNVKTKNEITLLAGLVTSKIEDGNVKAAFRLLSSEDKPAMNDEATVNALRAKYPITSANGRPAAARQDYTVLQITQADIIAVTKAFPTGSLGGPNGVRPQHMIDMVSNKENGRTRITSVTSFVNLLLEGNCRPDVIPIFFGGCLITLEKKI